MIGQTTVHPDWAFMEHRGVQYAVIHHRLFELGATVKPHVMIGAALKRSGWFNNGALPVITQWYHHGNRRPQTALVTASPSNGAAASARSTVGDKVEDIRGQLAGRWRILCHDRRHSCAIRIPSQGLSAL